MRLAGWALLTALLVAPAAAGQGLSPADRGTQVLRAVLHSLGLNPLATIDDAFAFPSRTLIIVLGDPRPLDQSFTIGSLREYIGASGGALLVATDRSTFARNSRNDPGVLMTDLECGVYGLPVGDVQTDPAELYRGHLADCPLLQPARRPEFRSELNLLRGLPRVAANKPSFLRPLFTDADRLNRRRVFAELPEGYWPPRRGAEPTRFLIGIADTLGAGRYMVLADHSIFINEMMLQLDNDNVAFTVRAVNWLTEDGRRDRVLLLDEGTIRGDFDVNLDYIDPPLPHPDVLGPAVDRLWEGLEAERFFDRVIDNLIPPHRLVRYLLLGATVSGMAFALYRVTAGRYRPDATAARLPERLADLPEAPPPAPDLTEAGRELARAMFGRLLAEPDFAGPVPAGWPRPARALWELAAGRSAPRMTPARLERLGRQLDELQAAVSRGEVPPGRDGETA
jgi:hypothetical protein